MRYDPNAMNEIEKLDALGREYGFFLYTVHRCKDGWGAQWRRGNEDSPPYHYFTYYPTVGEMLKAETDRISVAVQDKKRLEALRHKGVENINAPLCYTRAEF